MRNLQILVFLLFAVMIGACGKSGKRLASERLALAKSLYQKGDTAQALVQLDSIRILFPTEVASVTDAEKQKKDICSELLFRKQNELDSVSAKANRLEQNFETEKTQFDRYTQYVHKAQFNERNWNKSFIQVHLDERGELFISSNYYGTEWLDHTGLRVYDQEIDERTDTVGLDDVNNHRSDFLEYKWEKVTYRYGKDHGVIDFIAKHSARKLKAVFLGKRMYYIMLEESDKRAVKDALGLSFLLKKKRTLEKDIKILQAKAG